MPPGTDCIVMMLNGDSCDYNNNNSNSDDETEQQRKSIKQTKKKKHTIHNALCVRARSIATNDAIWEK